MDVLCSVPTQVDPLVLTKAASSGRPALGVTWTAPSSERPITKYQVQYRTSGSTSWSTKDVTSTSTTLEGLSAGTRYEIQVRAVSDVGAGQYSSKSTKTTYRGMNSIGIIYIQYRALNPDPWHLNWIFVCSFVC